MTTTRSTLLATTGCAVGLAALLLTSGAGAAGAAGGSGNANGKAASARANADKPVPGAKATTKYLQIDAMDMIPDGYSGSNYTNSWGSGLTTSSSSESICFNTGFNPPTGTKLTGVRVYFTSDASYDPYVQVTRRSLSTGAGSTLVSRTVVDNSGTFKGVTLPLSAAVDNSKYSFGLGICVRSGTTFKSARISYQ